MTSVQPAVSARPAVSTVNLRKPIFIVLTSILFIVAPIAQFACFNAAFAQGLVPNSSVPAGTISPSATFGLNGNLNEESHSNPILNNRLDLQTTSGVGVRFLLQETRRVPVLGILRVRRFGKENQIGVSETRQAPSGVENVAVNGSNNLTNRAAGNGAAVETSSAAGNGAATGNGEAMGNDGENPTEDSAGNDWVSQLESPKGTVRSIQFMLIVGALSLVPALLIMTTSFVRIIVVLSLLRQALGVQNLPPQQVVTGLAVFMTIFIMYPTFQEVYNDSLLPYQENQISLDDAWKAGLQPIRRFMSAQIQKSGNDADVWLFWRYAPNAPTGQATENLTYDDVPTQVLIPAFMVSELKIAFLMGVKFFIPFLIIDFLVASVTVSMGIMMLPPVMISLPLKLLLFVMLDGWHLVVESLIQSFF